jgi:hypothetical protein
MNRDYTTDTEAIAEIVRRGEADLAKRMDASQGIKDRLTSEMSDKVIRKRLRRISNLCEKYLKYHPQYAEFDNYRVLLMKDEYGKDVVDIKFNGSTKPGHILSIHKQVPLWDLAVEIKRMAEISRHYENQFKQAS